MGGEDIAPRILNLGTRWRWMVSFTPRPLYPQGNSPWYPLDRRQGGPQSRPGHGGEEKNSQPPPGIEPPIIQPLAKRYTTELSRLHPPSIFGHRHDLWSAENCDEGCFQLCGSAMSHTYQYSTGGWQLLHSLGSWVWVKRLSFLKTRNINRHIS
jgi:hypothetical protein